MNPPSSTTAILVFTRTINDEVRVKQFARSSSSSKNKKITRQLIRQTLSVAKKSHLPVFTSYSSQQVGVTFGERLLNAMESIFAKGFQNVIAIGNDCPNLTTKVLLKANEYLKKDNLVLGPDNNGGLYLLGINQSNYLRADFLEMSWETSRLQYNWSNFLKVNSLEVKYLENLDDVNDAKALLNVLKKVSPLDLFCKKIIQILSTFTTVRVDHIKIYYLQFFYSSAQLRAPPAAY